MTYLSLLLGFMALALPAVFAWAMQAGFKAPRIAHTGDPSDHNMDFETVAIPLEQGDELFAWHLIASSDPSTPTVIIQHGWGANMEMMLPIARLFYEEGLNVLLADARNHGHSPDDGVSSLPQFTRDCEAAINWLKAGHPGRGPLALLGHSVGAGAVLLVAAQRDDIDAVISVSSFAHPLLLMQRHLQRPQKSLFFLRYMGPLVMAYTQWMIGARFEDIAPMNALCEIKCEVLLVHGTRDTVIPLSDMRAIEHNCPNKKPEILLIEGAGHESVERIKQHGPDLVKFLKRQGF